MDAERIWMPLRIMIYFAGIICVSLGIVLCKKCGLGISPISGIPFVLEYILPVSFGMLTTLFHFANTALQIVIGRKCTGKLLLQIPLAIVFGYVINFIQRLLTFEAGSVAVKVIVLSGSVFFTALGMVLMVNMQLVQNPPDGTVRLISIVTGQEMGKIKVMYDVICVVISVLIGIIFCGRILGFGIATIVSALTVGRLVTAMNPRFCALFASGKAVRPALRHREG